MRSKNLLKKTQFEFIKENAVLDPTYECYSQQATAFPPDSRATASQHHPVSSLHPICFMQARSSFIAVESGDGYVEPQNDAIK